MTTDSRWVGLVLVAALGVPALRSGGAEMTAIGDKTLVAWVQPANLSQRGGSVLTLDDRASHFDGIVLGEIEPARWMAGSDVYRRTWREQAAWPAETAAPQTCVAVAIVYRGNHVALYRDGQPYAEHDVAQPQAFGPESVAVFGLRHLDAGDRAGFAGVIREARVYDRPLTAEQVAALVPGAPAVDPAPLAWWLFTDGQGGDRSGRFPECALFGGARLTGAGLLLDGRGSHLVAGPSGWLSASLARPGGPGGPQDAEIAATRSLRYRLLADPHRPTYHFAAPEGNCMPFDPNGALYWQGAYHLCYIFQDERGHCWGHASSTDLVHWRHHPPALAPNPGDPDRGIFSGNAFVAKDGRAVLLYHGVGVGNCIATSTEATLDHWTKLPTNPIVPSPKQGDPEFGRYQSWDPHGWLEGDTYYAIFGGRPATLFKASDLAAWQFAGPLLTQDLPGVDPDEDISCPDLFRLGDRYVLVCISHKRGCRYYVGRFENERFVPERHERMNWPGGTCFAPESLVDAKGRRVMWAWVLGRRPGDRIQQSGWSGVMTLPRVLSLGDDGTLRMAPAEELAALRTQHRRQAGLVLPPDRDEVLPDVVGNTLELALEIDRGAAAEVGLRLFRSPDGSEQTTVAYDHERGCLRVDVSRSSLDPAIVHRTYCMFGGDNPPVTAQEAPLRLAAGEPLRLRVFLDRSILEVFANGRQCVTQRLYPTRADSRGVALYCRGGRATVTALDAWDMAPANPF